LFIGKLFAMLAASVLGIIVWVSAGAVLVQMLKHGGVATLPPHLMARIPNNLGTMVQSALSAFPPLAAGKIGLEYRSRWWENDLRIYGGSTETDSDLWHIWYPSHDFHARRGLLVGYYHVGPVAETFGALAPAQRTQRAVELGARIHGAKYRTELASSFSVAWHRMPYLEGAWVAPPEAVGVEETVANLVQWLRLAVEVTNRLTPHGSAVPGSGYGLVGMRERVELAGGDLRTGPTGDGRFRVLARFPVGEEGQ